MKSSAFGRCLKESVLGLARQCSERVFQTCGVLMLKLRFLVSNDRKVIVIAICPWIEGAVVEGSLAAVT